jgi:hypothetical protein
MSVWIGTKTNPFTNHITLSDAVLTSLGAREDNNATGTVQLAVGEHQLRAGLRQRDRHRGLDVRYHAG